MTLLEVVVAMFVLALVFGGMLDALAQTHRMNAAVIAQSNATAIAQGYMEQLKTMLLSEFINSSGTDANSSPQLTATYSLPTCQSPSATAVQLYTTPPTVLVSTLLGSPPGTTPTGANVVDNLQSFDVDNTASTATTTWSAVWPHATSYTYSTASPGLSDLHMNFWLQITDLNPSSIPKCKSYGILLVYTWQYNDGTRVRYQMSSLRGIRSAISN
jgi:type II secretory pathway pseudopilin PulG